MKFIAHRGESIDAPENTLASFQLAWERDADGIEGDFHLLKDGNIACMHDANTHRTTGVNTALSELDLNSLKQLDAGKWKAREWAGAQVPLLEEVLKTIPQNKEIYMELKGCHAGSIAKLGERLRKLSFNLSQLVIIAFDDSLIKEASEALPKAKTALLSGLEYQDGIGFTPTVNELIERMQRINADGIDCYAHDKLDIEFIKQIKDEGYEFHVWTVNDLDHAAKLCKLGVDSITSDCAGYLKEKLCGKTEHD
jgi:glycerophosphoryl diester phosphodiesterase